MPSHEQISQFPWNAVSWLLVNEGEAENLMLALGHSTNISSDGLRYPYGENTDSEAVGSAHATLRQLTARPTFSETNIICTLGPAGALASIPSIPDYIYLPATNLEGNVRDTTGAGDCFTGYLVAGLMQHRGRNASAELTEGDAAELLRCSIQVSK